MYGSLHLDIGMFPVCKPREKMYRYKNQKEKWSTLLTQMIESNALEQNKLLTQV